LGRSDVPGGSGFSAIAVAATSMDERRVFVPEYFYMTIQLYVDTGIDRVEYFRQRARRRAATEQHEGQDDFLRNCGEQRIFQTTR